jgi:hypothetical protein
LGESAFDFHDINPEGSSRNSNSGAKIDDSNPALSWISDFAQLETPQRIFPTKIRIQIVNEYLKSMVSKWKQSS